MYVLEASRNVLTSRPMCYKLRPKMDIVDTNIKRIINETALLITYKLINLSI